MSEQPPGTAKERILVLVEQQPDDSSFEQILQELSFARMVERGLADADAGRVLSHKDVVREMKTWSK